VPAAMKAMRVILLLVGGVAFGCILIALSDRLGTRADANAGTNVIAAVPQADTQPTPEPASPAVPQVTADAAGQPANDSAPAEMLPSALVTGVLQPLPGRPMPPVPVPAQRPPLPPRPRTLPQAQPIRPPLPFTPGIRPATDGRPPLRRLGLNDPFTVARERMVAGQLAGPGRGITNAAVLAAMRRVPRHRFVDAHCLTNAYVDMTLVFPNGVILETPYVIAVTAVQLAAQPGDRVLDVEPGTAYDAAVFSLLVREVYVTESVLMRAEGARINLERLGYTNNVLVRQADVAQGWPEAAPFDTIVFNGPLAQFPESLLFQLKPGGRVIIPVSDDGKLSVLKKYGAQLVLETTLPVRPPPIPGNQVEMHVLPVLLRPPP